MKTPEEKFERARELAFRLLRKAQPFGLSEGEYFELCALGNSLTREQRESIGVSSYEDVAEDNRLFALQREETMLRERRAEISRERRLRREKKAREVAAKKRNATAKHCGIQKWYSYYGK